MALNEEDCLVRVNRFLILQDPARYGTMFTNRSHRPIKLKWAARQLNSLTTMALAALEEVAARCRHEAQPQARGIAVALAFLAFISRSTDRHFFDRFWRALRTECHVQRSAEANAALNAIYDAVGRRREITVMIAFEQAAREIYGAPPGYPAR